MESLSQSIQSVNAKVGLFSIHLKQLPTQILTFTGASLQAAL